MFQQTKVVEPLVCLSGAVCHYLLTNIVCLGVCVCVDKWQSSRHASPTACSYLFNGSIVRQFVMWSTTVAWKRKFSPNDFIEFRVLCSFDVSTVRRFVTRLHTRCLRMRSKEDSSYHKDVFVGRNWLSITEGTTRCCVNMCLADRVRLPVHGSCCVRFGGGGIALE